MTANDTNTTAPASVEGTWSVTIHGPTGPQETTLELNTTEGTLGGIMHTMGQVEQVHETTYDSTNGEISWINKIKKPLPMSLKFAGVVEGATMSGKVKAGLMGSFPFTAVKK